ncbi:hypothetical protein EZ313_17440 [Ramlibacter henchirensis]|uniref:Lipoprotein n=1 Tax=Ramlibacter henchirensis TaxID=204072 RepID=A0A4Z0BYA5_9BURK|nr:hypothetical protein [Ramlibacter henchirensis]TFZ03005.1 hypothetical protein EZ313_17440 [Ramlibacter henchirensis]
MRTLLITAAVLGLAACGEDPQIANRVKQDAASFQGTGKAAPYMASGWKAGDRGSWEAQLKTRTQMGQNDYAKVN